MLALTLPGWLLMFDRGKLVGVWEWPDDQTGVKMGGKLITLESEQITS